MVSTIYEEPQIEPVSLSEIKSHLRLDSDTFGDAISEAQSIKPDSYSDDVTGTSIDVSGYNSVVVVNAGDCGGVTVKIQESDDNAAWSDFHTFDEITASNDNAVYEREYTGTKQYIRAVATVTSASDFAVTVVKDSPTQEEDELLNVLIQTAREDCEAFLNRALITQTWDAYFSSWPRGEYLELPYPPLQSVTSVTYTDSSGAENTFSAEHYSVDTDSEPGRIVLNYGETWPTESLATKNPIKVRFVAGYGDNRSNVPAAIRTGIKVKVAELYENREDTVIGRTATHLNLSEKLWWPYRIWG